MVEACPICLLPAADPATCTVCSNHHPIHTACARDMLARMGRDACPVCSAPITLPRTPVPALYRAIFMLEHSLHLALGYVWLFWVFFNTFGFGEALDDAKTQIRLAKATYRARRTLHDDTPDLDSVRFGTATTLCVGFVLIVLARYGCIRFAMDIMVQT